MGEFDEALEQASRERTEAEQRVEVPELTEGLELLHELAVWAMSKYQSAGVPPFLASDQVPRWTQEAYALRQLAPPPQRWWARRGPESPAAAPPDPMPDLWELSSFAVTKWRDGEYVPSEGMGYDSGTPGYYKQESYIVTYSVCTDARGNLILMSDQARSIWLWEERRQVWGDDFPSAWLVPIPRERKAMLHAVTATVDKWLHLGTDR
ncbi:hypothetical protein [Streptomyces sp. DSM 40484]|uniref:hypothetical protein n=1 Tax=Streptomyces kroppenstedtii TaxID=3051181 RepID=UPI0028D2D0EC|nr:hypothetical protein [Streptomyces sp. DSM 40484]